MKLSALFLCLIGYASYATASFNLTLSQEMYELDVTRLLECMAGFPIPFTVALGYSGNIYVVPGEGYRLDGRIRELAQPCFSLPKNGSLNSFTDHYVGVDPYSIYGIHDDPRGPIGFFERGYEVYYGPAAIRGNQSLSLKKSLLRALKFSIADIIQFVSLVNLYTK